MGQLTNQFVSQSYQGLLNLANANTGLTANLQTVTDGLGGSSPLQISQTQVNISGAFTVNGAPVSVDTGSLVTKTEFNSYTSSVDLRFDGIELETGSLQNQINQKLDTGSFNTYSGNTLNLINTKLDTGSFNSYTSSVNTKLAGLDIETGSLQNQINGLATTGSLSGYTTTTVFNNYTSSNDSKVNSLISQTGSYVTETESGSFVTSITQPAFVGNKFDIIKGNGSVSAIIINNVNNAVSSSYATNALSASYAPDNSNRNGLITTGSIGGNQSITGSLDVQGTISATSASFTYVNTVYETASVIYSSGSNQFGDASNDTQTLYGTVVLPSGPLDITGSLRTSGQIRTDSSLVAIGGVQTNNISNPGTAGDIEINSGLFKVSIVGDTEVTGTLKVTNGITGSLEGTASFATNAVTSSISYDLVVNGKCDNPGGLTKGTIVRITGANGDNPLFNTASWEDDANSANTLGMLSEDVAYNAFANIVVQGKVIGINTNGMTAGDMLYLSSSGQYTTSSVPAPYHEVRLGQVLRPQLNQGSAYISVDNGYELTELHDVDIQSPVVGDVLTYISGSYGQWVNKTVDELGYLQTSSFNTYSGNTLNLINQKLDTGSFNTYTASMDARTGSYATTGSNRFIGDQTITGSVTISGSAQVELDVKGDQIITGSMSVRSGSLFTISNNTLPSVNPILFLSSSDAGQTNIIKGWGDSPSVGGAGAVQANYTGSLRITGSNNIVSMPQIRATGVGGGVDQQGYISGSDNTIATNGCGIFLNTGSLLFPKTNNNYVGASSNILMNFTTSSLAGGHPILTNNTLYAGQLVLNSNSGSMNVVGNLVNGGSILSNQNFVTNTRVAISANYINQTSTLNHISSSINYNNNLVNSPIVVNNHLSSSALVAGNSITVSNNTFVGGSSNTGHSIWASGSQSSQASRNFIDNLVGGKFNILSSSFVSSSNSSVVATMVYGQSLIVNGNSGTGTAAGGAAFLGRFNDTGSLSLTNDIVFAVGTGTSAANRRTSFYITSGSLVNVSGSLNVNGVTNALVVTGSSTITHNIAGQNALTVVNTSGTGQPALFVSGTLNVSGSGDHSIAGNTIQLTGSTLMYGNGEFPLTVYGTINSKRLHFNSNPFNSNPSSNLGAIRMGADNQTFQYTNYDTAQITTQSFIDQYVNTGSLTTQTKFGATYGGTTARVDVINNNGTRRVDVLTDSMTVTGSVNLSSVMNMRPLDPLPAGNIGDLAVSASNQLYFYNGTWTLIV